MYLYLESSIVGFVSNISPVKTSKRGIKYFDFTLETDLEVKRVVSFSQEKHKLIKTLNDTDAGCQIKKVKLSETNDILLTDYTTVKKVSPTFTKRNTKMDIQTLEKVNNEIVLFQRISTKGMIYGLGELEYVEMNGQQLPLTKCMLKDETSTIPLTIYGKELIAKVKNDSVYD